MIHVVLKQYLFNSNSSKMLNQCFLYKVISESCISENIGVAFRVQMFIFMFTPMFSLSLDKYGCSNKALDYINYLGHIILIIYKLNFRRVQLLFLRLEKIFQNRHLFFAIINLSYLI